MAEHKNLLEEVEVGLLVDEVVLEREMDVEREVEVEVVGRVSELVDRVAEVVDVGVNVVPGTPSHEPHAGWHPLLGRQ